jgi:hypothetical protein
MGIRRGKNVAFVRNKKTGDISKICMIDLEPTPPMMEKGGNVEVDLCDAVERVQTVA